MNLIPLDKTELNMVSVANATAVGNGFMLIFLHFANQSRIHLDSVFNQTIDYSWDKLCFER